MFAITILYNFIKNYKYKKIIYYQIKINEKLILVLIFIIIFLGFIDYICLYNPKKISL